MRHAHPDQDSEVIEPLVPKIDDGISQIPEDSPQEMSSSCIPLHQPISDEISYFTWDIEQVEPLVPVMSSGGSKSE